MTIMAYRPGGPSTQFCSHTVVGASWLRQDVIAGGAEGMVCRWLKCRVSRTWPDNSLDLSLNFI